MVKYIVLLVGALLLVLGVWGIVGWWQDFLLVLKGGLPIFLGFVGLIMAIAAIGEIRDAIARKREEEKERQEQEEKKEEKSEEQKQE